MSLKGLPKIIIGLSVLLITTTMFSSPVSSRKAMMTPPSYDFMEQAAIVVNCSDATLITSISLMSSNVTFVRYPSGVDMINPGFALCESVSVSVTPVGSALVYIFDTTETAVAKGHADAITPSIGGAFSLSFSYFSVGLTDGKTNVTYTAPAITNILSYYTATLKPTCLKSDLAGFSSAIPNLLSVLPSKSYAGISAHKTSGDYDWQYIFFAGYFEAQIPTGSGYTINILNRLGVSSLVPSNYAQTGTYYMSTVPVVVEPKTTVSFVSCNPANISSQYITRGWYVVPQIPFIDTLSAIFFFGNETTPVTVLTFTFSGLVVPKFSSLTLIIAIIVCTIGAIVFKKRFPKSLL
jgi:hypothetical protein